MDPGRVLIAGIQATVAVVAIDMPSRRVVVQGPSGNRYPLQAGPRIPLEKLRVGDRLLATYLEAVAVRLEKAGIRL